MGKKSRLIQTLKDEVTQQTSIIQTLQSNLSICMQQNDLLIRQLALSNSDGDHDGKLVQKSNNEHRKNRRSSSRPHHGSGIGSNSHSVTTTSSESDDESVQLLSTEKLLGQIRGNHSRVNSRVFEGNLHKRLNSPSCSHGVSGIERENRRSDNQQKKLMKSSSSSNSRSSSRTMTQTISNNIHSSDDSVVPLGLHGRSDAAKTNDRLVPSVGGDGSSTRSSSSSSNISGGSRSTTSNSRQVSGRETNSSRNTRQDSNCSATSITKITSRYPTDENRYYNSSNPTRHPQPGPGPGPPLQSQPRAGRDNVIKLGPRDRPLVSARVPTPRSKFTSPMAHMGAKKARSLDSITGFIGKIPRFQTDVMKSIRIPNFNFEASQELTSRSLDSNRKRRRSELAAPTESQRSAAPGPAAGDQSKRIRINSRAQHSSKDTGTQPLWNDTRTQPARTVTGTQPASTITGTQTSKADSTTPRAQSRRSSMQAQPGGGLSDEQAPPSRGRTGGDSEPSSSDAVGRTRGHSNSPPTIAGPINRPELVLSPTLSRGANSLTSRLLQCHSFDDRLDMSVKLMSDRQVAPYIPELLRNDGRLIVCSWLKDELLAWEGGQRSAAGTREAGLDLIVNLVNIIDKADWKASEVATERIDHVSSTKHL